MLLKERLLKTLQSVRRVARLSYIIHKVSEMDGHPRPCHEHEIIPPQALNPRDHGCLLPSSLQLLDTLNKRKSVRTFTGKRTNIERIKLLLRSAYGYTTSGRRTVPSAGGYYSLRLYAVRILRGVNQVYLYNPHKNSLEHCCDTNAPIPNAFHVYQVAFDTVSWLVVWTVQLLPVASSYGARAYRYVLLEAGHSAQNLILASLEYNISTITLGGFDDTKLRKDVLSLRGKRHLPLYTLVLR